MASPKTYTVERQTVIAASPEQVHAQLDDFHRWRAWSPWEALDPEMERTYSGAPSGAGAAYAWSGNRKAGSGRMRVVAATPTSVQVAIDFEKPFASSSTSTFVLTPAGADGASTRVTWTMVGPRPLVMRLLGPLLTMDKIVGRDFERGLERLKAVAEAPGA